MRPRRSLAPVHFHPDWPSGPWGVNSVGRDWYVCHAKTLRSKRIGHVMASRANYFYEALDEAARRNAKGTPA